MTSVMINSLWLKEFKRYIKRDTPEAPLNMWIQRIYASEMVFLGAATHHVEEKLWALTAAYMGISTTEQQRKQPHSKSRFDTLESSTSTQPGSYIHTRDTKLPQTTFNAVNNGIRSSEIIMPIRDPG